MSEKWYEGLSDDAFLKEEDKKYKEVLERIKKAVDSGTGFEEACNAAGIDKSKLNDIIIDDALKVLIAEMHFAKQMPTDEVAAKLKLPVGKVNSARENMLKEIAETVAKEFHKNLGSSE